MTIPASVDWIGRVCGCGHNLSDHAPGWGACMAGKCGCIGPIALAARERKAKKRKVRKH